MRKTHLNTYSITENIRGVIRQGIFIYDVMYTARVEQRLASMQRGMAGALKPFS